MFRSLNDFMEFYNQKNISKIELKMKNGEDYFLIYINDIKNKLYKIYAVTYVDDCTVTIGSMDFWFNDEDVFVDLLMVAHEYRNQNIGKSMVKYLTQIALENNINVIRLHSTESALKFYKKLGFKSTNVKCGNFKEYKLEIKENINKFEF